MASLSSDPNGNRTLQFSGTDRLRRSIRLGKVNLKTAREIKTKIENLVAAKLAGHTVDDETNRWLAGISDALASKLAAVGLIPKRNAATLGAFLDHHIKSRSDVKPLTHLHYGRVRRDLVGFFGADKPIRDILPGHGDEFRLYLLDRGLAENTVRRICGRAKQFFRVADRLGLIRGNPFADLVTNIQANHERFYFVSREESQKVLDACPDNQWRLLFALARFGGLRVPSEPLALTWGHINWAENKITVPSPKTEHHHGGASRIIPIFPELRPYLEAAFDAAEPGTEHVITRYRNRNSNLRTQLERIVVKAGLKPWPKTFQNLRSTRETELARTFEMHVVCAWIGNSQPVAAKHYLQVTDEHFSRALGDAHQTTGIGPDGALQKAVQYSTETTSDDPQPILSETENPAKSGVLLGTAVAVESAKTRIAPRQGLERSAKPSGKRGSAENGAAKSGASGARGGADDAPLDPDLERIIVAWPGLSDRSRKAIVALVEATSSIAK